MSLIILILVAWMIGCFILRPLSSTLDLENALFRIFTGIALVAMIILTAGTQSLQTAISIVLALAGAGFAWEVFTSLHSNNTTTPSSPPSPTPPLSWLEYGCLAITATALTLTLASALAPATSWDACVAHLALPQDYTREGRILPITGNEYSAYPHLLHSLYTYAFFMGGEQNVMLLSWGFGVLTCGTAFLLGRRLGGRETGIASATILATTPIFFDQASTASIDLAFCGFTLAALTALTAWHDTKHPHHLLTAAFLAGSSCGIRHTGYLICTLLTLDITWEILRKRQHPSAILWFIAIALAGTAPWLIRSTWITGNPFYPFFNEWFHRSSMTHRPVTTLATHESIKEISLTGLLRFPYDLIMRPNLFDGWTKSPGGLILFLGIPGLILGNWRARRLGIYSLAGITGFYFFQRFARYTLPFFAPMMAVAALPLRKDQPLRPIAATALTMAAIFSLGLDVAAVHFKIPVLLGKITREEYLTERIERYPAFKWAQEHIPQEETILTFDRRTYFLKGRTWQNDEPLKPIRQLPIEQQAEWLRQQGILWLFLPITYIEESPGYHRDFQELIDTWRNNPQHFRLIKSFDLPRPHRNSVERIEIYYITKQP